MSPSSSLYSFLSGKISAVFFSEMFPYTYMITTRLDLTIDSNSTPELPESHSFIPQIMILCLLTCEENKWCLVPCFHSSTNPPKSISNLNFLKLRSSPLTQQICKKLQEENFLTKHLKENILSYFPLSIFIFSMKRGFLPTSKE